MNRPRVIILSIVLQMSQGFSITLIKIKFSFNINSLMNDLHYKTGLPIWVDKEFQVLHGVKLFTEEALVIYRYSLGQEQKNSLENDLGHFKTSNLTHFPKTSRLIQKGKDLYDFVVQDIVGQRLVSSPNRCSILALYQIYQAYNELRKLY